MPHPLPLAVPHPLLCAITRPLPRAVPRPLPCDVVPFALPVTAWTDDEL